MDENEILRENQDQENANGSNQDSESVAGTTSSAIPADREHSGESLEKDGNDSGISANSDEDSDSDSPPCAPQTAEDELAHLRSELKNLQEAVAKKDAFFSRLGKECEDFATLFPDVPLSSLPESVWNDVKKGIPLSASYALLERRLTREKEIAEAYNQKNGIRSAGSVSGCENDYFSPDEVRAMSEEDVRLNYSKIMQSMQKWH